MTDLGLAGSWALITGSTRGIGRATAEALAGAGAHVVVTSRSREDAREVAASLEAGHGVEARGVAADVSDRGDVEALFEAAREAAGDDLDVLVNNAGFPWEEARWETPLHEVPRDELAERFQEVRAVDLDGARFCTWEALRTMRGTGGSIVFVSSTPALAGYKGTPYTEAKAGILGLMRDVAREYGPDGVRANAVAPGNVDTGFADELADEDRAELAREAPLRRWGEPGEVADAILFLASDLASYVTGQTLVVDGGTERR